MFYEFNISISQLKNYFSKYLRLPIWKASFFFTDILGIFFKEEMREELLIMSNLFSDYTYLSRFILDSFLSDIRKCKIIEKVK